ncbi:MAG: hypothetical protein LGB78_04520, partial [Sulfurovum sp.]|nr:hypothetical protein [Sulfurovum sp.]
LLFCLAEKLIWNYSIINQYWSLVFNGYLHYTSLTVYIYLYASRGASNFYDCYGFSEESGKKILN